MKKLFHQIRGKWRGVAYSGKPSSPQIDKDIKGFNFYHIFSSADAEDCLPVYRDKYNLLIKNIEFIDNKIDSTIKYLGLGAGGASVFLGITRDIQPGRFGRGFFSVDSFVIAFILLGIVFWAAALFHALSARSPVITYYMPSANDLFWRREIASEDIKKGYSNAPEKIPMYAILMLYFDLNSLRLLPVQNWKGERLKLAYRYLFICLSLFLIASVLHLIFPRSC